MIDYGAATAAEERDARGLVSKFPDPRKSYTAPPAAGRPATDTRMNQASSQQSGDGASAQESADGESGRRESGAGPGAGLGAPLTGISTEELRQELVRRQRRLTGLMAQRERLAAQLAEVSAEIVSLGGTAPATKDAPRRSPAGDAPRRARAHNEISLPDAIAMAVEVRATVTPAEAAELVRANGYQTTAKNFGILVAHTLAKDSRFKRLERGRYERVS